MKLEVQILVDLQYGSHVFWTGANVGSDSVGGVSSIGTDEPELVTLQVFGSHGWRHLMKQRTYFRMDQEQSGPFRVGA